MAATRSVERACFGCFREEIRAVRRAVMAASGNANCEREGLFVFLFRRNNAHIAEPETSMTTLTSYPFALLLNRLFDDAEKLSPAASPAFAHVSAEEREQLMRSKTAYRDFYGHLKDFPLAVSRETGTLLYMLARSTRARTIVE